MADKKELNHIAVIPDANRRWAVARGLIASQGHEEGMKRMREVAEHAFDEGVNFFTGWAGSENNLRLRSKTEVKFLAKLAKDFLREELEEENFIKRKTQIRIIGKWDEILNDAELRELATEAHNRSKDFQDKALTMLFGYNGDTEMLGAISRLKESGEEVSPENLRKYLWTGFLPDVDLVIRTGGEPHWSVGFLMWLTQNSQFYFTEKYWPDFGPEELSQAMDDFKKRGRRFGK